MLCSKYQEKLSDYIDGLLSLPEQNETEMHLSECAGCRAIYEDLVSICEASRNLPDYEPSPLVWERISAAIASESVGMRILGSRLSISKLFSGHTLRLLYQPSFATAAVLLIAVIVGSIMIYRAPHSRSPQPGSNQSVNWGLSEKAKLGIQPTGLLILHKPAIDVETVQQRIRELQAQIEVKRKSWNPEIQLLFKRNVEIVDQRIARYHEALARNPGDPVARELYLAALEAKLEMLKQFAEM